MNINQIIKKKKTLDVNKLKYCLFKIQNGAYFYQFKEVNEDKNLLIFTRVNSLLTSNWNKNHFITLLENNEIEYFYLNGKEIDNLYTSQYEFTDYFISLKPTAIYASRDKFYKVNNISRTNIQLKRTIDSFVKNFSPIEYSTKFNAINNYRIEFKISGELKE